MSATISTGKFMADRSTQVLIYGIQFLVTKGVQFNFGQTPFHVNNIQYNPYMWCIH
jgi:hypothetical protein